MAPKRDQLFTRDKFDAFMGADDDDDNSVGSARGSIGGHSSKLGGLAGLRPVSPSKPGLGSLGSPGKPSSSGAHSRATSEGLGGLGSSIAKSGLGGLGRPAGLAKPPGGLGGLKSSGGLGGLRSAGGLGGLKSTGGGIKFAGSGAQEVPPAAPLAESKALSEAMSGLSISVDKVQTENIEALKSITSMVQELAEKTLAGFHEVSNRLNQTKDEPGLQDSLDALIKNMDEEIAAKGDKEVYIVVPGRDTSTVTTEEAADIMKDRSVRVFGSVGLLATAVGSKADF